MNKKANECIKYYLNYINSEQYELAFKKSEKEDKLNHLEYIKKEKPQWKSRTDYYYENTVITKVVIIDILSNKGVSKLIKKLYSLPKKSFKVTNYYKKPTLVNQYDYIKLQYSHSQTGRLAVIEFLNDQYLREINISWSQVNNYYAVLEYEFSFKRSLNDKLYSSFMCDNLKALTSKDYTIWYHIDQRNKCKLDELLLTQMHSEYFPLLMQHYITTYLYTEQGNFNPLINFIFYTRKEPININKLYLGDFGVSYYNKKENYVISSDLDETNYCLLAGNDSIPYFRCIGYIAKYKNNFYYRFGGIRELRIFEQEFSKFSSGRKRTSYNKDYKTLLTKLQSLSETTMMAKEDMYEQFDLNWDFFVGNDKKIIKEYDKKARNINYQKIYQDNFSYLNFLSEMNNTKSNHILSIVATAVSIIAVIISIIALLQ